MCCLRFQYRLCVAAIVLIIHLPSGVLCSCCFPNSFVAKHINLKDGIVSSFLINFSDNRMKITPKKEHGALFMNVISDYNEGLSYVRYNDGGCRKEKITPEYQFERCIPAEAHRLYDGYLGPDHSVDTVTYTYQRKDQTNTIIELTVTQSGHSTNICFPVFRRVLIGNTLKSAQMFSDVIISQGNTDKWLRVDFSQCE